MKKSKLTLIPVILFLVCFSAVHAADITTTAQGGLWDDKTTWVGGVLPTDKDNVIITSVITTGDVYYSSRTYKMVNLTVNTGGKILREKEKAGRYMLEISGNLVNNGEIIDYKDYFDIYVNGNLTNNGILKPRTITLVGQKQQISTTKPIECKTFNLSMEDNEAFAGSNLQFKNCYIPANGTKTLNMGLFNLSLSADSVTYDGYYGEVYSKCELSAPVKFDKTGTINLDKSVLGKTVTGNFILQSPSYAIINDLTVEGNMTIDGNTKVTSKENLIKLIVKGNFTNYGELNKDSVKIGKIKFPRRSMYLTAYGNISNLGVTGITTKVLPISNGKTISMKGNFEGNVEVRQAENSATPGGKVVIDSEVSITGDLSVYANLEISSSGSLNMLTKLTTNPIYLSSSVGSITNNGKIYQYHRVNSSWGYRSFTNKPGMNINYELRSWDGQIDGVDVTVFNGSTYPNLPGSTKRWWRLTPVGSGKVTGYTLKLFYDESMLNGQKEKNLKVFRSGDEGKNWEAISVGNYTKLDTIENSITIGEWNTTASLLKEFGDFVISSGDGSVPVESPIKIDLVGRPDIRIGAPNPFKIHVYNVTDFPSTPLLVAVNITSDMRFKEFRLPYNDGVEIIPIDSMGNPNDDTQVFYIPYLDPNEHYSFDVIVYGIPDGMKSASARKSTVSIGQIGGKLKDEAQDMISEGITGWVSEWANRDLSDEENAQLNGVLNLERNHRAGEKEKYGKAVTTARNFTKAVVEKIADKNPVSKMIFKIGDTVESVYNLKDKLRRRMFYWFYKEIGLIKEENKDMNGKQIQGKLVSSWDPNEMIGPAGYGEQNFMSSIPLMNYTILFENKKEATAPAYRIQIIDTLSAVFDPETVKFGATSHSESNYKWKMERNGNILKWDIEGIELPPNQTPPEGEGFVSFSVNLVNDIQSGAEIKNRATIVFDMNPPIMTNTWTNVIDMIAPRTVMKAIKYTAGDSLVTISCEASDNTNGSGTGRYGFYASVNNAPFQLIGESFENTMKYPVSFKSKESYRFYALAVDNVNNAEKSVPQAVELKSIPLANDQLSNFDQTISVYPNPTKGEITLDFFVQNQSNVSFNLFSVTGELVVKQDLGIFGNGQHRVKPDISHVKQGLYVAKITLNNEHKTLKILIN